MYKIVPGLEQNEYDRERDFYRDRGLPCPKDQVVEPEEEDSKDGEMTPDANTNMDFHRFDEQVCLSGTASVLHTCHTTYLNAKFTTF